MIEVIPALMARDLNELKQYFAEFAGLVKTVQLDVMDGVYVHPKSFPYNDLTEFEALVAGGGSLSQKPQNEDLNFEVDLMIENPVESVRNWIKIGASRVIVHVEGLEKFDEIERIIKEHNKSGGDGELSDEISVELGLAIGTTTANAEVSRYISKIDFIQCMGIEKIGYQGAKFDNRVIAQIEDLRKSYPDLIISVDGGVSEKSARALVAAGASRLVSGSAILESKDKGKIIETLARG